MKGKRRTKSNQGNSYIMVVATVSFLAVLVAAILVAVALCYRLKAYDLNARDNFYYLEQAMDEIYAGVGGDSMQLLNQAYDDTLEVMVYYDTATRTYMTMDNDQANKMMKATFMQLVKDDVRYKTVNNIKNHLNEFLSYPYDPSTDDGKEGIQLSVGNLDAASDDEVVITNLVLKREAEYSTVNARSRKDSANGQVAGGDTFIQTITTDLVIGKPQFDVNFNNIASDLSELYGFSMISDLGIEIIGADGKSSALGNKVNITGNVYAASDFYNKSYNEEPQTLKTIGSTTVEKEQIQKVHSYDDDQLKNYNGVNTKSMYSGLYIDGATVVMASDKIIIPGTLAIMNCADLTISSIASASVDYTDIWADGIVLDGYALRQDTEGKVMKGSSLNMKAKAYIYDDLELNANSSSVLLNGQYFGYNYASLDNRTYVEPARAFTKFTDAGITDGQGIEGQAHYNSSAIILNGENTTLDFSATNALYVAGQSYIEVSKNTRETEAETITYTVQSGGTIQELSEDVKQKVNSYPTTEVENGDISDNYTTTDNKSKTAAQDYRTGEAISIKSNQLAYIPNWAVHDEGDELYVSLPTRLQQLDAYQGIWSNFDKIPVIKTVMSGKKYYFLDFSKADLGDKNVMNQFIADYAALFDESTLDEDTGMTEGERQGLLNITDYDYFQVKMLDVTDHTASDPYANIYTNSAITTREGDTFTIVANKQNIKPLIAAANNINAAIEQGNNHQTKLIVDEDADNSVSPTVAVNVTAKLQDQYKEMKWLLTKTSTNSEFVTNAHNLKEEVITPINHYFDFSQITSSNSKYCGLESGYGAWVSDGDIEIGVSSCKINNHNYNYKKSFVGNKVRGIVIAKGTVTFTEDVAEFEGLIVTGGKIIVNNFKSSTDTMSFMANEEIVKTVLRECDNSRGESGDKNFGYVCDLFRLFVSQYVPPNNSTDTPVVSMKDVSAVQFEDILSFRNWKRNVD